MCKRNAAFPSARILTTLAVGMFVLTGCASGPKSVEIKALADPVINRDVAGRPLSVVVHVYQLKDAEEFSKLTFDTLASGRPLSELLGKDLLEANEVVLVPGSEQSRTDKILEDTRYVGVVAFFRQPDQHYWRILADADEVRSKGIEFKVRDCYLSLTTPKLRLIPGQPAALPTACLGSELRPLSVSAAPVSAQRVAAAGANTKRSSVTDTARQAADFLLTKKP